MNQTNPGKNFRFCFLYYKKAQSCDRHLYYEPLIFLLIKKVMVLSSFPPRSLKRNSPIEIVFAFIFFTPFFIFYYVYDLMIYTLLLLLRFHQNKRF